jgi:hypothetical protein
MVKIVIVKWLASQQPPQLGSMCSDNTTNQPTNNQTMHTQEEEEEGEEVGGKKAPVKARLRTLLPPTHVQDYQQEEGEGDGVIMLPAGGGDGPPACTTIVVKVSWGVVGRWGREGDDGV